MDRLLIEPAHVYHARKDCLSAHRLAEFRRSPACYRAMMDGEDTRQDAAHIVFGHAFHTAILEPETFDNRYICDGPINPSTRKTYGRDTLKFAEWLADQKALGRQFITPEEHDRIVAMRASLSKQSWATLLTGGVAERVARGVYYSRLCQARPDYLRPAEDGRSFVLADLKSTADLDRFERDAVKFSYVYNMAFYVSMLAALGIEIAHVYLIAVETAAPYRAGCWQIPDSSINQASYDNEYQIGLLRIAEQKDCWPTGYETIRTLERY